MASHAIKKLQSEFELLSEKQDQCLSNYQKCFDLLENFNQRLQHYQNGQQTALDQLGTALKISASTSEAVMESNEKRDEKMEMVENEILSLKELQSSNDIENIKSQINDLKTAVESLRHETSDSIAYLNQTKSESRDVDQSTQRLFFDQHISIVCKELVQRQEKQRNLIVFGLSETTNDYQEVEALICDIGVSASVSSVYRVGNCVGDKPRPLVVRFRTASDRESVKNNLRKLKGQIRWDRVSVCPDLTKMQCAEEKIKFKQLLEEQKCKNEESTKNGAWKIVGSRGKRQLIFKPNNP